MSETISDGFVSAKIEGLFFRFLGHGKDDPTQLV
jgi:hypothetical protein